MHIGYTIVKSPLGHILIAATARGVAIVRFGDVESTMQAELAREYPEAELERDRVHLGRVVLRRDARLGQPQLGADHRLGANRGGVVEIHHG